MIGYDGHKKVKGSKIHAAVTPDTLPINMQIGPANEHDSRKLITLIQGVKKPKELHADKAYDTPIVRTYLAKRRIKAQIPRRSKKRRPGRPTSLNYNTYKKNRSAVERFFAWLGGFRRLKIRYKRLASTFKALIHIACFQIHWRVFG